MQHLPLKPVSGSLITVVVCNLVMITFGDESLQVSWCSGSGLSGTMFKWHQFLCTSPESVLTTYDLGDPAGDSSFPWMGWLSDVIQISVLSGIGLGVSSLAQCHCQRFSSETVWTVRSFHGMSSGRPNLALATISLWDRRSNRFSHD